MKQILPNAREGRAAQPRTNAQSQGKPQSRDERRDDEIPSINIQTPKKLQIPSSNQQSTGRPRQIEGNFIISALVASLRFCLVLTTLTLALSLVGWRAWAHADLLALIEGMTKRIEADPRNAELHLLRGELYRAHADWTLAEADYNRAEQLKPKLAGIELARGKLLFESGRDHEARAKLDKYLAGHPDDIEGLITRAQLLAKLGDRSAAAADYTSTIARSPALRADFFLDRAKLQADAGNLSAALAGLDEGLQRLGPLVALQIYAIDLECARKNYDQALRRLQIVTDASERKEKWLARRGEILSLGGRHEEARGSYAAAEEAIASLPPRLRTSPAMVQLQQQINKASQAVQ